MKKNLKRTLAKVMAVALTVSLLGTAADADAAKKIKLAKKSITITKGKSKKVKIKNVKAKKVKKLTVKSSKKKIATVKKSGKTAIKVTGKKKGSAKITVKVTLKGKKKATKLTLKVKVQNKKKPAPTTAPTAAPTAAPTNAPSQAPTNAPTQAPTEAPTDAPAKNEYGVSDPYVITISEENEAYANSVAKRLANGMSEEDAAARNKDPKFENGTATFTSTDQYNSGMTFYIDPDVTTSANDDGTTAYTAKSVDLTRYQGVRFKLKDAYCETSLKILADGSNWWSKLEKWEGTDNVTDGERTVEYKFDGLDVATLKEVQSIGLAWHNELGFTATVESIELFGKQDPIEPTEKPTEAPTEKPTEAPTTPPVVDTPGNDTPGNDTPGNDTPGADTGSTTQPSQPSQPSQAPEDKTVVLTSYTKVFDTPVQVTVGGTQYQSGGVAEITDFLPEGFDISNYRAVNVKAVVKDASTDEEVTGYGNVQIGLTTDATQWNDNKIGSEVGNFNSDANAVTAGKDIAIPTNAETPEKLFVFFQNASSAHTDGYKIEFKEFTLVIDGDDIVKTFDTPVQVTVGGTQYQSGGVAEITDFLPEGFDISNYSAVNVKAVVKDASTDEEVTGYENVQIGLTTDATQWNDNKIGSEVGNFNSDANAVTAGKDIAIPTNAETPEKLFVFFQNASSAHTDGYKIEFKEFTFKCKTKTIKK